MLALAMRMACNNMHARYAKSRKALLDAAVEILSFNPGASISDIADKAGVGRATLYRHFASREELVHELAMDALCVTDEVLQPLREDKTLRGRRAIEESMRAIMPLADRFHFVLNLWAIAGNDEEVMAIYNRQLEELYVLVEEAKVDGDIAKDISTDWVVASLDALLSRAWWMISEAGYAANQAAELMIRTAFDGVAK